MVELDQAGSVLKVLTTSVLLGCNSLLGNPDQRSLGGMIIMQIGILRNLGKECGKRTRMKEPVSVRMTGRVIVNLEKGGTTVEIMIGHWTRTKGGTGKEIVGVNVIAAVMIKVSTGIMVVTMIEEERGNTSGHITTIVIVAGTMAKIMSMQITEMEVVTCMRGVHMATVILGMKEIWLVMVRIMATMSSAKVMMLMVMVKMVLARKLSTQKPHEHGYGTIGKTLGHISTEPGAPEQGEAYEKGDY